MLELRELQQKCKLISTKTSSTFISIYVKVCSKCNLEYKHLDYKSGWVNYDNYLIVSVKLLETILSKTLSHNSLHDTLLELNRTYNVPYIYAN